MPVTDHGNFDFAIEVTEEMLSASLLTQVQAPTIPSTLISSARFTVKPQLVAAVTRADCRSAGTPTVALIGTLTGNLLVESWTLPVTLPPAAALRQIDIDVQFTVFTNPAVGTVGGTRGLVFSTSSLAPVITLNESRVLASFPVQQILILAYLVGGQVGYDQARIDILTTLQTAIADQLRAAMGGLGNFLAIPEPPGLSFRSVLTNNSTLKLLITVVPPDGNAALVSGLTVRRDSLGGPVDHVALAMSNAHVLGGVIFPALVGALGLPSTTTSRAGHPCLLFGAPLPSVAVGAPLLPGVLPATISLDFLFAQIDASGIRIGMTITAAAPGGVATVTMRATIVLPLTASVTAGALNVGIGVPAITTSTDIAIDPAVYVIAFFTGGAPLVVVNALIDAFGGGLIDSFIRDTVLPSLNIPTLPSVSLPLAGPFAALGVNLIETAQPSAPGRSVTVAGLSIGIDRVNDVIIRLL